MELKTPSTPRLRALCHLRGVMVRLHSAALGSPRKSGVFALLNGLIENRQPKSLPSTVIARLGCVRSLPAIRAMGTAEISLIVSAAAAAGSIGAVVITYRLGRQRFDHERRLSDIDSATRVLDDAASTMQRTNSLLESVTTRLYAYASPSPSSPWNEELLRNDAATLKSAGDELTSLAGRLRTRFGSEHGSSPFTNPLHPSRLVSPSSLN
jgi:hypothetical protein